MENMNVMVLGGGYVAALHASQLGLTLTLIEKHGLGDTCLHRG